ncbi:hypothetical protein VN12_14495 [Pirellula sp. SH-Sr6A]|uniref:carboxypeptidase-like regulatory domain-containing protein n=1 Tax=Pirellula sp. SH-Sr6A TaxID=1632865 RepID=UPI00078E21BD|nr:carboxypeptidase-like regulatory domain-containing protein [Pirellula sp. SH-Sr6A]AMV33333.1 hypothetical protein VN12_14495 [Pirellula sp. SH-Sr6A]
MTSTNRWKWLLPALGMLLSLGCGGPVADYSMVELVTASGTVTMDGAPLAGAVVTFEDRNDDTFSYALTDAAGNYVLQFDSEMKGVKTGKKVVRISTTKKILGLNTAPASEGGDPDAKRSDQERVPEKYNKKSILEVEVSKGSVRFDFDLKST